MKKTLLAILLLPLISLGQKTIVEELSLKNGEISLPGTLTIPAVEKPPLLIFVHGSGNVDRNGNQGAAIKANYINQLADSLNRKGIAFYRYDKRTSNPQNFTFLEGITIQDFVSDVSIAISNFKDDTRFKSIHLIGHSQGSLIAMLAADENIKSYISIAGPGESIDKTLVTQISKQNSQIGEVAKQHVEELKETDTILSVNPFLIQLFAPQNQKFLKSWIQLNPIEEIKKIEIPTLIVQGGSDLQVTKEDASKLANARNTAIIKSEDKITVTLIQNMNHVLKTVKNSIENQNSYTSPDFPLSKKLVESISEFIFKNE
jgi:pimeloyl-ACP methyl ester carboxylesterase